jgi:hypothetical protein
MRLGRRKKRMEYRSGQIAVKYVDEKEEVTAQECGMHRTVQHYD